MKIQRCVVPLAALTATLGALVLDRVTAADGWDGDEEDYVDNADMELEEDFADMNSLGEMNKLENARQKRKLEEEAAEEADDAFVQDDDDELESSTDESAGEAVHNEDPESDIGLDLSDLELEDEETSLKAFGEVEQPVEQAEEPETAQEPVIFGGQVVQRRDDEGIKYDISSLNPDENFAPYVGEFVDKAPTFKKEEEEKEKKKAEQKRLKQQNNNIDVYRMDQEVFLEAKLKNKDRFDAEVENAEAGLEPPKAPTWWQRAKHWFSRKTDNLVEKYGTDPAKM